MAIDGNSLASLAGADGALKGGMQFWQLHLLRLVDHAARWHSTREIVTRNEDGSLDRRTWQSIGDNAHRLSAALRGLGIRHGDRIAILAWNSGRHLESWFGIAGVGAVSHTINPRLFEHDIAYIFNDGGARVLFVDPALLGVVQRLREDLTALEHVIVFSAPFELSLAKCTVHFHDQLVTEAKPRAWEVLGEDAAAGLCYTSGTTGRPKGVLYSHRSHVLHALAAVAPNAFDLSAHSAILPVVPMYHAFGWGLPFAAAAVGAKLLLTGSCFDSGVILDLIRREEITLAAAVPTIWRGILDQARYDGQGFGRLQEVLCGGAPAPGALLDAYEREFGLTFTHAWGMTELSPIGTVGKLTPETINLPVESQKVLKLKQGRPLAGIELKLVNEAGAEVIQDGRSPGRILVRGAWVIQRYFKAVQDAVDADGWFDTGDIGTLDSFGFMQIVDRAKDIIKSGGEWISSVALEDASLWHKDILDAACIGVSHERWDERPLLLLVVRSGSTVTSQEVIEHLRGRVAKWWLPDQVIFVAQIPRTATGKIDKRSLRERYQPPSPNGMIS